MKINSKNRGFAEGTMVLMADGKQKPIEDIRAGDYVLSFDEYDADAALEPMVVLDTFERIDNNVLEVTIGDTKLKVAQDQMFIGPHNDWKQVYNHSKVVDVAGNPVEYKVNKIGKGKHRIYDITVDENHSLIANGIRVHNALGSSATSSDGSTGGSSYGSKATSGNTTGVGRGGGPADSNNAGSRQTGGAKGTTNNKGTNTTKDAKASNNGGGGKTAGQSANASHGGGSNLGGGNKGNNDGNRNQMNGNGQNASQRKANNGQKGYSKKKKGSKDEPDPIKPSGISVASRLISSINSTALSLGDLIDTLDPNELKTFSTAIQESLDIMYSFTESLNDSIVAAEMSSYDKSDILNASSQMLSDMNDERKLFNKSSLTASDKRLALTLNTAIEELGVGILQRLGGYTTADSRGGMTVTVNGNTTTGSGERPGTYYRKDRHGKYVSTVAKTKEKKHRIRGKKRASENN